MIYNLYYKINIFKSYIIEINDLLPRIGNKISINQKIYFIILCTKNNELNFMYNKLNLLME